MLDYESEEQECDDESEEWKQIQQQFLNSDEKVLRTFTSYLGSGDKGRLTNLRKAILFLNNDKLDSVNTFGIYVIVRCILQLTIHTYHLTDDDVVDMMNFINTEARHFGTPALIKAVDYCLEFMKKENDTDLPVRWIEIFGRLVAVLAIRGEFEYEDDMMTGQEFKAHVITSICRLTWGQNNGASLIAALREIPGLNPIEVENILDTAGSSMKDLEPSAVPPIAYQLLLLAGSSHPARLVYYFDKYFAGVYNEENREETSALKKKKALGTTVFHFIQGAKTVDPVLKELLRRIKASQYDHDLVMQPFMLSVALGLTSIEYIKSTILDGLRNTILKRISEIQQSEDTAWYYSLFGPVLDTITNHFKIVVEAKTSELDFMLDGLKDLAIGLVDSDQLVGQTQLSKDKCQKLGNYLLCTIVERHSHYLPTLMNEFLKNQSSIANIECLAKCLSKVNATIIRKQYSNRLHELIHYLPLMTVESAAPVLKALLPAFQLSSDLLGELLMILRKTIWKSIEARRVSVTAMILLLSNSTIVGSIPKSQFCMTQDWTNSQDPARLNFPLADVLGTSSKNESICFEVLTILKRFLTQQVEVREHVYLGVRTIIQKNPELIPIMCSQLQIHTRQHMSTDLRSLSLKNVLSCNGNGEISVLDNLGLLIQTLGVLTLRAQQIYEIDDDGDRTRPKSLLICEKFMFIWYSHALEAKIEDFETQAGVMLGDGAKPLDVVRNVRNHYIVQFMQVIEALIEFISMGGSERAFGVLFNGKTARDMNIKDLFKKFKTLAIAVKAKLSKKETKGTKKAAADKTTTSTPSSSAPDPPSGTTTVNTTKAKIKLEPVKKIAYSHILAAESVNKILADLYHLEDQFDDPLAQVKYMVDFDRYILDVIKQKVTSLKNKESLKERVPTFLFMIGQLTKSCYFLWNKLTVNAKQNFETIELNENQSSQPDVSLQLCLELDELRIELVSDILELANQRTPLLRLKILSEFLQESNKSYDELFDIFFEQWSTYYQYQVCVISKAGTQTTSKAVHFMFRILSTLLKGINVESREVLTKLAGWFEVFLKKKSHVEPTCGLMESVLQTFITVTSKHQKLPNLLLPLAKRAHYILGDLDEEDLTPEKKCWLVTAETSPTLIYQYGLYVEKMLELVKGAVNRLNLPSSYNEEEMLAALRKRCCRMMSFILQVLSELIRSCFPAGQCVDVLQKAVVQFFNVMASITENLVHFHIKSSVSFDCPQFESLVKDIGNDFKIRAETLITHIEGLRQAHASKEANTTTTSKKKKAADKQTISKHKFTKDARTIPVLVYSIEKYEQQLILLCQKTKENLLAGTKMSTARDFRIVFPDGAKKNVSVADITTNTNLPPNRPSTSRSKSQKESEDNQRKTSKSSKKGNTTTAESAPNPKPGPSKSKPTPASSSKSNAPAANSKDKATTSNAVKATTSTKAANHANPDKSLTTKRGSSKGKQSDKDKGIKTSDFESGSGFIVDSDESVDETVIVSAKKKTAQPISHVVEVDQSDDSTDDHVEVPQRKSTKEIVKSKKIVLGVHKSKAQAKGGADGGRRSSTSHSHSRRVVADTSEDEQSDTETGSSNTSVIMATPDDEEEQELLSLSPTSKSKKRALPLSSSLDDSSSETPPPPKRKPSADLNGNRNESTLGNQSRAVAHNSSAGKNLIDGGGKQISIDKPMSSDSLASSSGSAEGNGSHSGEKPKTAMRRLGLGGVKRKHTFPPS